MLYQGFVGLLLVGSSLQTVAPRNKHSSPLTFSDDGTFQISVWDDTHFGNKYIYQWGPAQDRESLVIFEDLLNYEPTPGLVVFNGDLINGEDMSLHNATDYVDMILGPFLKRDLTWASTYGNHDYDFNISGEMILEREQRHAGSRTRSMVKNPNAGTSNYFLPVYDPKCASCRAGCVPEMLLWFFDSRGGHKFQATGPNGGKVGQPNWVDESVAEWFVETNARLTRKFKKTIPSMAFVHIPTYASLKLQEKGIDANRQPGINDDNPLAPQAERWCPDGTQNNACPYGGQDTAFMSAIVNTPGLMAVFSGHDHGATWCAKWETLLPGMTVKGNGVNLCFGQHSAIAGYGDWERGTRQILVSKDSLKKFELDTWIRLQSGTVVGDVTLNSTFGYDYYAATPNTKSFCKTCQWRLAGKQQNRKLDQDD